MKTVLVVDDDPTILRLAAKGLVGVDVETAVDAESAVRRAKDLGPDAVLLDIVLPDGSGMDVFRRLREFDSRLPVIFITSEESSETAIEAMKLGALDYITKPLDVRRLREVVDEALETRRLMSVGVAFSPEVDDGLDDGDGDVLIGRSPGMLEVYKAIASCARQTVPVLIRGESGTGKELVARALYQHGDRAEAPFLAVNCAALADNLLESELFGHEKGAFTGAVARRIGKFEQCDGGTIFLDEIGDMSLVVQAKVLRLLQQQEFQRVGGNETIRTDVRILSATNRPLEEMCEEKTFREDLYFRLNGYPVNVPPLRERGDDRRQLLEHFTARFARDFGMSDFEGVSEDALDRLLEYEWPGNVREMEAVVRQALLDTRGPVLVSDFLPPRVLGRGGPSGPSAPDAETLDGFVSRRLETSLDLYAETVEFMERRLLVAVLRHTTGNQSQAAEILGITRGKLRNRIKAFGIDLDDLGQGASST